MVSLIDMHVYLAQNTMMTHVALVCEPKASSCRPLNTQCVKYCCKVAKDWEL